MKVDGLIVVGAEVEGRTVDVNQTAVRLHKPLHGLSLEQLIFNWPQAFDETREMLEFARRSGDLVHPKGNVAYLSPIRRPRTFRDFYAFETHVRNARKLRGQEIDPNWYRLAIFYFSNPNNISTSGADIPFPRTSMKWDYELEIGAVLGGGGSDLAPEDAETLIAGFCVLNDWSARDLQREEMASNMGPAKGKDFATSLGVWLVTPDEIEDRRKGRGYDLRMTARVNGEIVSDGNWADIYWSFGDMIARASKDATVFAGELIGSGTVGNGCLLERGFDHDDWLKSGDEVELEIEGLGKLTNRVA